MILDREFLEGVSSEHISTYPPFGGIGSSMLYFKK